MPDVIAGEWLPDRTDIKAPAMVTAENMQRVADGYRAFSDAARTPTNALDDEIRGAWWARSQSGQEFILAGTQAKLFYAISDTFEEKGTGYSMSDADQWDFDIYGDRLIAVAGLSVTPQTMVVTTPTAFTDLSPDVSFGHSCMTFRETVILGNIQGRGVNASPIGRQEAGLHWSEIGDPTSWPLVGGTSTSDFNVLEGDGGPITDMAAASEYAAIFRERQLWRMDLAGPAVFTFRKIDDHRGCVIPNSAIAVGNLVYYIAEEGFMVFDGGSVRSIGHEKVDRTWRSLQNFSLAALSRTSTAHDPDRRSIFWAIPTTGTQPDFVFGYNYELGQWWYFRKEMEWLFSGQSLGQSLDDVSSPTSLGNLDMDAPGTPPTALGDQEMDVLGGTNNELLLAFLRDHALYEFNDDRKLKGTLVYGDVDAGQRALLRYVRPVYQGTGTVSAAAGARFNPGEPTDFDPDSVRQVNGLGVIPLRKAGRYLRLGMVLEGEVDLIEGFDYTAQPLGQR